MSSLEAVLLVEDNTDDVELIRHAFRKAQIGSALHVVGDGDMAMAYLAGTAPFDDRGAHPLPSLILLDLKLPRRSGFEVLEWMRGDLRTKHTPVVVLTSSNQEADIERAYTFGAISYLVKPVSRDALLDIVRTLNHYWTRLNLRVRA
jgi:CheY-like chemotaxis protein